MTIAVNPWVESLEAYVPGEQPRDPHIVKLNTNECPYANPALDDTVRGCAKEGRFNKYPDPSCSALREAVAARLGTPPNHILVGNGSDETLRLVCQAFIRPGTGDAIGMLEPSYSLYETLGAMFGAPSKSFPLASPDYALPLEAVSSDVKIFFLPNPNPPIGNLYSLDELRKLAKARPDRLLVIDEAYVDFAERSAVSLVSEFENLLVTRTFSKSYALAGMRIGFAVGAKPLIDSMKKIKDSYNVNRVSQAVALAAWKDEEWLRETVARIRRERTRLTDELRARRFDVPDSQGNFVLARRSDAKQLYQALRTKGILVRYFDRPSLADAMRITIGIPDEMDRLLAALDELKG